MFKNMFKNLNTDPNKKPRLLGELGDLSHTKVSSSEFKYKKDAEIFGEAEPAVYIYQVIEGAVRTHKLLSDRRRQIGAFHLPNDIFGLENEHLHRFTAEAIVKTTVRLVRRESLEREATKDPAIVRHLLHMTTDNLQHVENHLLLLGRETAAERVAAFLIEMNDRQKSAGAVALPMTRRDICRLSRPNHRDGITHNYGSSAEGLPKGRRANAAGYRCTRPRGPSWTRPRKLSLTSCSVRGFGSACVSRIDSGQLNLGYHLSSDSPIEI